MPYLTPNSDPETVTCRLLYIPDDPTWIELVSGALLPLLYPFNFEQYGTSTPEETASRFGDMLDDFLVSDCEAIMYPPLIGEIRMRASANLPAKWLRCEGQSILRESYPDLFTEIGTLYGSVDGTHFNVPDFRDTFPMGTDHTLANSGMNRTGGAASVTLTTAQIPSHSHNGVVSPNNPVSNRALVSTGGVQTVKSAGTSDVEGGGGSHENRPPFRTLAFIIYAGV